MFVSSHRSSNLCTVDQKGPEAPKALQEAIMMSLEFGNFDEDGRLEGDLLDEESKDRLGKLSEFGVESSVIEEVKEDLAAACSGAEAGSFVMRICCMHIWKPCWLFGAFCFWGMIIYLLFFFSLFFVIFSCIHKH